MVAFTPRTKSDPMDGFATVIYAGIDGIVEKVQERRCRDARELLALAAREALQEGGGQQRDRYERGFDRVRTTRVRTPSGATVTADQAVRQPAVTLRDLIEQGALTLDEGIRNRPLVLASVETALKFEGYLRRQLEAVERARRHEDRQIPASFAYASVPGLSREMVQRFEEVRPETLGPALRIPGATPAAVAVLGAYVHRLQP